MAPVSASAAALGSPKAVSYARALSLLSTVAIWYGAAAAAAVFTKLAVRGATSHGIAAGVAIVATVCAANMSALAACACVVLVLRGRSFSQLLGAVIAASAPQLVLAHAVGNGAATAATVYADASVVQAIKATEPAFAVFVGHDSAEMTPRKLVGLLLVIVAGLTCGSLQLGDALWTRAGALGISLASVSNLAFALRNVSAKAAMQHNSRAAGTKQGVIMDGVSGLCASSVVAAVGFSVVAGICVLLRPVESIHALMRPGVLSATLLSSVGFAGYQLASTFVLERVSPVTHALVNVGKRVFIVTATAIAMGTRLSPAAAVALAVLVAGLALHNDGIVRAISTVASRLMERTGTEKTRFNKEV